MRSRYPVFDAFTLIGRTDALQARRVVTIDEDGQTRISILPPEAHGDRWNGSAR